MAGRSGTIGLLRGLGAGLGHLLFPRLCEGCRKPLVAREEVICLGCELFLSKTNYHLIPDNETVLRLSGRFPFVHATSLTYFSEESLVQHLVHRLKYQQRMQNGRFLGRELGRAIGPLAWGIDTIVPVPLHRKKETARGYNQAVCVAEGIAEVLRVPVVRDAVVRHRFTESQTDKTREERISNVRDAFRVVRPQRLEGKHVLLTDDVLTTGATVEACAGALLQIMGLRLSVATVGIAK